MPNSKRKLQFEDPTETAKRLEQNKNYQKGFRERRKEKLRQLEEKVAQLEAEIEILRSSALHDQPMVTESLSLPATVVPFSGFVTETAEFRYHITQLEAENAALKLKMEQRVLFDIPLAFRNRESSNVPSAEPTADLLTTKREQGSNNSETSTPTVVDDTWWSEMIAFSDAEEGDGVVHPNQKAPPSFNVAAVKKELASVAALSNSQALIDDFCNLFVNPQCRLSSFLHDNAEKRQALLNQCNTEVEKKEVMDALDRGRKENLEYIQYLQELVTSYESNVARTAPSFLESHTSIDSVRELLRQMPSLQNDRGRQLLGAFEHSLLSLKKSGSNFHSLELLKIRYEIGDIVSDPNERNIVFDLLLKLGSEHPH
ncbi:UNVERIFIED_CONTAM: hypothetical protein HDU68_001722 [Siphonaria sp. JEL0065]|nr:hypothetical protein HDU68_001722 [Siphonaria sp. JEL0065]